MDLPTSFDFQIKKFSPKPGDVMIVRAGIGSANQSREKRKELADALSEQYPTCFWIVVCHSWEAQLFTEDEMRALGWVRAADPSVAVDSPQS